MLRMEHLEHLAVWATSESSIPCLAALFGWRLAATVESVGLPLDHSLLLCQKCETILQPGNNCTVRIEECRKVKVQEKSSCATKAKQCGLYMQFLLTSQLRQWRPKGPSMSKSY